MGEERAKARAGAAARFVMNAFSTEATVYGIVLVTALTAIGWKFETDLEVLGFIVVTTLIFWVTHVYARAVVAHDDEATEPIPVKTALGESIRTASAYRYSLLKFQHLAARAGWRHRQLWMDGQSRVAVHVLEPSRSIAARE